MKIQAKDKFRSYGLRFILVLATAIILTACATGNKSAIRGAALGDGSGADPYNVTIHFASSTSCTITGVTEDPAKCSSYSGTGFCMQRSKFVQWESDPVGVKYEIYFDPIQGAPMISNANGVLKKKIDSTAPYSIYKYSILGDGCDADTDTWDPYIRVNN